MTAEPHLGTTLAPAADHALAILTLLASQAEPLPASVLSDRLGLPRSTVYRLLGILGDRGSSPTSLRSTGTAWA